jgi:hypothetical protein
LLQGQLFTREEINDNIIVQINLVILKKLQSQFAFFGHDVSTVTQNYYDYFQLQYYPVSFDDPNIKNYDGDVDARQRYDHVTKDHFEYISSVLCPIEVRNFCKLVSPAGHPLLYQSL